MKPDHVELAGGITYAGMVESRGAVMSRAPAWWRAIAERDRRRAFGSPSVPAKAARAKPTAYAGWLFGVCCPGTSGKAYSPDDRQSLRERFSDSCLDMMFRQVCSGSTPVRLTWKHGGIGLASTTDLGLVFRRHQLYGLEFEARLAPGKFSDLVLRTADEEGLGVSLGYRLQRARYEEQNGYRVRVVEAAELDHVALVSTFDGLTAVFSGARAFGKRGHALGCPEAVANRARAYALEVIRHQRATA